MKQLLPWWPIAAIILQGLTAWAAWSMRQFANKEVERRTQLLNDEIDALRNRLITAEGQITEVRQDVDRLPTKADIAHVEGEVKVANAKIDATIAGIKRLEDYFLANGTRQSA